MKYAYFILLIIAAIACRKEEWDTVERPGPCVRYNMEDLADTVTESTNPSFGVWIFSVSGLTDYKVYVDDSLAAEWEVEGPEYDRREEWCSVELKFISGVSDTAYIITIANDRMGRTGGDTLRVIYNSGNNHSYLDNICWGPSPVLGYIHSGNHYYQTVTINGNKWVGRNVMDVPNDGNYAQVYPGHDSVYGYIYDWEAAMSLVLQASYHLPTRQEYVDLINFCGGNSIAGYKLKECGANHWKTADMQVMNQTGFSAIPGGNGNFATHNLNAWYWTSTEHDSQSAYAIHFIDNSGVAEMVVLPKTTKISVRQVHIPVPTVQQMLNSGTTPLAIYQMGFPVDSLLGKMYQGGYIFEFSEVVGNGMVATTPSTFATIWGCEGTINTLFAIGYGLQNSETISQFCGTSMNAAHYCLDLNQNGYDNWYLPTIYELMLIHSRLYLNGIGNYEATTYWSSTCPTSGTPDSHLNGLALGFNDGATYTFARGTGHKFIAVHNF